MIISNWIAGASTVVGLSVALTFVPSTVAAQNNQLCICQNLADNIQTPGGCGSSDQACADNCSRLALAYKTRRPDARCVNAPSPTPATFVAFLASNQEEDGKNGDPRQCLVDGGGSFAYSNNARFSEAIRLRTDGHYGGCKLRFGMIAPVGVLDGFKVIVDIQGTDGNGAGQCFGHGGTLGRHELPLSNTTENKTFDPPVFIDTDSRPGGCYETWSIEGTNTAWALEILNYPENGGDTTTCSPNTQASGSPIRVTVGKSVRLFLDMDLQKGCAQQFRIVPTTSNVK